MIKDLKLSYILMFVFSAILIAWQTLSNFFGGVAINFVALLGIVFTLLLLIFKNKELFSRIKDLFFVACVFCILELVIYFACEFGYGESLKGFIVYQNIISFLGLLFLAYVCFRFITEFLNKKIKFIEIMLGNVKRTPKEKKAKELTNGTLEEKPNKHNIENTEEATHEFEEQAESNILEDDSNEIVIETEE